MPETIETDYLIIGAGAMGLAFADVLFDESPDARIVIVDRRSSPGGHWTDAYAFVCLHQPALFYGVNSQKLETNRTDLASGPAIVDYFRRLMNRWTASGRVTFMPLSEGAADGTVRSLIDGQVTQVRARKRIVDAGFMNVEIPSQRPPPFPVADGIRLIPPNGLYAMRRGWSRYVVLGGGKTGIDAVLFLLGLGVDLRRIHWVVPSDSWFWTREKIQGGLVIEEFEGQIDAIIRSRNIDEVFLELERRGSVSRLSPDIMPSKWRCATISRDEQVTISGLQNVVRMGRVERIDADRIVLQQGEMPTGADTLHIDCTANGLAKLPPRPVWSGELITLQSLMMCQQVFSAALIARMELSGMTDEARNALCEVVPHPEQKEDLATCLVASMSNLLRANRKFPVWLRRRRLSALSHESVLNYVFGALRMMRKVPLAEAAVERIVGQRAA